MNEWLSIQSCESPMALYPSSNIIFLNQQIFFPSTTPATCLASVVESVTILCNFLIQITAPLLTLIN